MSDLLKLRIPHGNVFDELAKLPAGVGAGEELRGVRA